jgi:hypothetical protein
MVRQELSQIEVRWFCRCPQWVDAVEKVGLAMVTRL